METDPFSLALEPALTPRSLPVVGDRLDVQGDIVYGTAAPRSVLNAPSATGIGCWSLNPYVGCAFGCAYCYARYAHRYVMERAGVPNDEELPPWLAFERRVMVKREAAALLQHALATHPGKYARILSGDETVLIGTATDPYQPAERRFRVTRGVLEVLGAYDGLKISLITKSPLIVRDIDVLARIATRSRLSIHVSLITLDRGLARRIEPRSPTPESRLRAVRRLADAGIDVGINVMPVLPGITDAPSDLVALVRAAAEAGASNVATGVLRLQPAARDRYLPWIAGEFPELAERYAQTYARSWDAGEKYRRGLRAFMDRLSKRFGLRIRTYDDERSYGPTKRERVRVAEQLALGL